MQKMVLLKHGFLLKIKLDQYHLVLFWVKCMAWSLKKETACLLISIIKFVLLILVEELLIKLVKFLQNYNNKIINKKLKECNLYLLI